MSMFNLTEERAFQSMPHEPEELAISALLKPPALSYLRDLQRSIDKDPYYLTYFDRSVSIRIQSLLSKQGIYWDDEIFEKQFLQIVSEALKRLRTLDP